MAIIVAAICTRSGAIVVSRHFLPISRPRVEQLLGQFPRLLQPGQQHTFVEDNEVRFLYQPLESHYLVLITSKNGNLLQDMDTLRLMGRIVGELAGPSKTGLEEVEAVREMALDILLAFDEVVELGMREAVRDMSQLETILAMESHEEVVQEIIAKNKMQEAKEIAKRKIKQMELEKKEAARRHSKSGSGSSFSMGLGGYSSMSPTGRMTTELPSFTTSTPMNASTISGGSAATVQTTAGTGKGMKLGMKKNTSLDVD